ncbi:hypothetical protein GGS23DRAFT_570439 [Durotheca rogersii]|uniref:uncharacterized protein n=1 Tax=Durotheca rogersii TaxID=419775 RepID=UPI00221E8F0D|nr:uncharacterized protein GGS23DRAFT_570439 [Durotheca rogersii]KAI5862483.1 hypothetical protein GGS23DRAFT_570439 [Durotheca rogersii]
MAEAQQEQPQAHQPQPEPVLAAAEEPAHALPYQSPGTSSLSQATRELEETQDTQGQARVETQATTPPAPDGSKLDLDHDHGHAHIDAHARTPIPQPANAEATAAVGAILGHAQEREPAPEAEPSLQPQIPNHAADANTPTSTPTVALPATAAPATTAAAVAAAADAATLLSARADTTGISPDSHHQVSPEATAPSSEAMSNNPSHPPRPPRQSIGYPNPTAYAPPGMGNPQYGYPNPGGQGPDAYRASTGVPNSAMALPSMRTFDSAQQQVHPQQHLAMSIPVNPVPSMPAQSHMAYFGQQSAVPMGGGNPYGLTADALGPRYALPPSGPGSVLGGRHKKEIKRRTKTGCLTCRKRRIKCDEQHPICKNCQKSKRECLGYDPIFKNQQQQQHPTNIRPAPNNPSSSGPLSSSRHSPSAPLSGSSSASTNYTTLPPVISNNSTSTVSSFSAGLAHPGPAGATVKSESLEYPAIIDPALDSVLNTPSMSTSHFPAIKHTAPNLVIHSTPDALHLRGGGPSPVPLHYPVSHYAPSSFQQHNPAYTGFPARKMKVHELVGMSGAVPPILDSPLTNERLAEVRDLYDQVYAPGLEKFFETEWYTGPQGAGALASSVSANEMLVGFLQSMAKTDASDVAGMQYSANLEFRVVWDLTALVYASEYKVNVGEHLPPPDDGPEARNRVAVFEALLAGEFLDRNPLLPPPVSADLRLHRIREFRFWYLLAEFLRVRDQPNTDVTRQRDHLLGQMRDLLDGRENRDVLYSLAVIRALAPNFPPDFESTLPPHLDESDPKSKLAVARKFIQDESQVTGGTTNIVRRFSELAVRAFIIPGSNIGRR